MRSIFAGICFLIQAIFITNYISAADNEQLVTELKIYNNDTTFRHQYIYENQHNKVLETVSFQIPGLQWENFQQSEFIYSDNVLVTRLLKKWMDGNWKTTYRYDYSDYTANYRTEIQTVVDGADQYPVHKSNVVRQNDSTLIFSEFSNSTSGWQLISEKKNIVRNSFLISSEVNYYNNGVSLLRYKNSYTYNAQGLISEMLTEKDVNGVLENEKLINWYYKKGTNMVSSQRVKLWSPEIGWENNQMQVYTYNSDNKQETEINYLWRTEFWEKQNKLEFLYDSVGKLKCRKLYIPKYHQWRNTVSVNYVPNVTENKIEISSVYGFWGGNAGELVTSFIPLDINNELVLQKAKQITVQYSDYNDITQNTASKTLKVYPNPSDGIFYFDANMCSAKGWVVLDMSGKIIREKQLTEMTGVVDISDMPKGLYILKINTNEQIYTCKLSKL